MCNWVTIYVNLHFSLKSDRPIIPLCKNREFYLNLISLIIYIKSSIMVTIFHSQIYWTTVQHSASCSTLFCSCFIYFFFFHFGLKLHLKNIFPPKYEPIQNAPWFIWKYLNKFPQFYSCPLVYTICILAEFCWCVWLWNKAAHIKKIIENSIGPAVLWDLLNVKNSSKIHKLLVTIHSILLILVNIALVRKGWASQF